MDPPDFKDPSTLAVDQPKTVPAARKSLLVYVLPAVLLACIIGLSVALGIVAARSTSAPVTPTTEAGKTVAEAPNAKEWNYALGGLDWPGECQAGVTQSPINIVVANGSDSKVAYGTLPKFDFGTGTNVTVFNTGHAIQVQWDTLTPSKATVSLSAIVGQANITGNISTPYAKGVVTGLGSDRVPVTPVQWHMHTPSEHTLNGKLSMIETHLVCKISGKDLPACGTGGCLAVFAVLYDIGANETAPSEFLNPFLHDMPTEIGAGNGTHMPADFVMDFSKYLPESRSFATYQGSLTTPPCSGNVLWTVMTATRTVSIKQLEALTDTLSLTTRETECYDVSETAVIDPDAPAASAANAKKAAKGFKLCTEQGQRTNNRFIQPVNGRPVFVHTDSS